MPQWNQQLQCSPADYASRMPKPEYNKGKILLVDDSFPFLRNFSSILRSHGYETMTAPSGTAAIESVQTFRPDVITLDYDMPGLDGIGTLLEVKQKHPSAKIVFISSRMDIEVVTQALTNGANECITKPVDLKRLIDIIENLTQK